MNRCKNLYYLSSLACMLQECLNEEELEILSADLRTLGEMLESVLVRRQHCQMVCPQDPAD